MQVFVTISKDIPSDKYIPDHKCRCECKELIDNGMCDREIVNFKAKDTEIVPYPLCLGHVSKDFSLMNTTNTGLFGYIYDFSVGYKAIANDKIHDIRRYLMEKNNIK